jgi:hypothetical protein
MAYQQDKSKGARINRTPAPTLDAKHGGTQYGQAQNLTGVVSVPPGQSVQSEMAASLREAQADSEDVLSKVIAGGIAGRDDRIPSDNNAQTRNVSAQPYPTTYGHTGPKPDGKIPGAK